MNDDEIIYFHFDPEKTAVPESPDLYSTGQCGCGQDNAGQYSCGQHNSSQNNAGHQGSCGQHCETPLIPYDILFIPEYEDSPDPVQTAALKAFGIPTLYPWQRLVIANIMDAAAGDSGCDEDGAERGKQIVLLPTGAGKSLCFLVPAILLPGPTLILYPLLALMTDQERRMKEGGMNPVVFRGQQTVKEREDNFSRIKNGSKVILANPEVLQSENLLDALAQCSISHIAVDEAHCVSEWGDTFRPAYLTVGTVIKKLACPVVTAFTATASPEVLSRTANVLFDGRAHIVRSESDRPNIKYFVHRTDIKMKTALILSLTEEKPMIIFCGTRKRAEQTARILRSVYPIGSEQAQSVKFYHAGLTREEKERVEKWFYPKKDGILTATCAFGMGVDKKDIKTVIHLDPPSTAEAYIQEAGRGGRDGSDAKAVLLWSTEDMIKGKEQKPGSRSRVLFDFAESGRCRRQVLLDALGGEEAACSGCDICSGTGQKKANDLKETTAFIRHNRLRFTKEETAGELKRIFDKKYRRLFGINIYEHADFSAQLEQLSAAGIIREGKILWKNKLYVPFSGKLHHQSSTTSVSLSSPS